MLQGTLSDLGLHQHHWFAQAQLLGVTTHQYLKLLETPTGGGQGVGQGRASCADRKAFCT